MSIDTPPPPINWADGASADVEEPSESKKALGWVGGSTPDRPPAKFFNWFWNAICHNLEWMKNLPYFYPGRRWRAVDDIGSATAFLYFDVVYAPWDDKFVLAGTTWPSGDGLFSSGNSDGDVWTLEQSGLTGDRIYGVMHNGSDLWVVFGSDIGSPDEVVMWTAAAADGTWTDRKSVHAAVNLGLRSGIFNPYNSLYLFGSDDTGQVLYTSDPTSVVLAAVAATGTSTGVLDLAANASGKIVLAMGNGGMSRSTNGGTIWAPAAGGVTDGVGTQRSVVWDPFGYRFLYGARRNSDDQLVICESRDGSDGTWTVHELDVITPSAASNIHKIVVGSRGEIYVSGTTGRKDGAFLAGSVNLKDWYGLDVPAITTVNINDALKVTQGTKGAIEDHFLVGALGNTSTSPALDGDVAARSETNIGFG
jgi:hypothetical protein